MFYYISPRCVRCGVSWHPSFYMYIVLLIQGTDYSYRSVRLLFPFIHTGWRHITWPIQYISRDVYIHTWRRFSTSACSLGLHNHFASGSRVRLPPGAKFFLARGSVGVRRTVVGPYRVRSKVRVSIILVYLIRQNYCCRNNQSLTAYGITFALIQI